MVKLFKTLEMWYSNGVLWVQLSLFFSKMFERKEHHPDFNGHKMAYYKARYPEKIK